MGALVYSFSEQTQSTYGDIFAIDPHSGDIFVKGDIDHDTASVYHLTVVAEDEGPDSLPDDATVIVRVQDTGLFKMLFGWILGFFNVQV